MASATFHGEDEELVIAAELSADRTHLEGSDRFTTEGDRGK